MLSSSLGKQIELSRKKQQLSQAQLEQRSGIKREYISRLERGKLKNPTINTIMKIANGLEVPMEELLLSNSSSRYLHELVQHSENLKGKINHLKAELQEMAQLLSLMEKKLVLRAME